MTQLCPRKGCLVIYCDSSIKLKFDIHWFTETKKVKMLGCIKRYKFNQIKKKNIQWFYVAASIWYGYLNQIIWGFVHTLRQRQNGYHFAGNILKCIFLNEYVLIEISLKFFLWVQLTIGAADHVLVPNRWWAIICPCDNLVYWPIWYKGQSPSITQLFV